MRITCCGPLILPGRTIFVLYHWIHFKYGRGWTTTSIQLSQYRKLRNGAEGMPKGLAAFLHRAWPKGQQRPASSSSCEVVNIDFSLKLIRLADAKRSTSAGVMAGLRTEGCQRDACRHAHDLTRRIDAQLMSASTVMFCSGARQHSLRSRTTLSGSPVAAHACKGSLKLLKAP